MATQETPKTAKYGRKWWVSCAFSARGAREGWDHHALNKTREYEDGRERRGRIRGVFHWRVDIFCLAAPRRRCRDFYCVYGVNATWRAVALSLIRLEPALVNESMRHLVCRLVAKRSSEIGPDSFRHSFTRSWMILDLGFCAGFRSLRNCIVVLIMILVGWKLSYARNVRGRNLTRSDEIPFYLSCGIEGGALRSKEKNIAGWTRYSLELYAGLFLEQMLRVCGCSHKHALSKDIGLLPLPPCLRINLTLYSFFKLK